jgi:uncharacterized LabA/DUF88 family protein/cold shock CspA family protein
MSDVDQKLLRIGVFYDGNFFYHVSNYYRYVHPRKQRIDVPGLHEFIRHHVAAAESTDVRYSQIVDAHFFRGRLWAKEADARQQLYAERVFDDILMAEGVVTHYLPIPQKTEKGIDVWLALEAFELAIYKRFNVLVLIAGDSDFIPLVRKLNSLGTRVMVLGWDFEYTDEAGKLNKTITSIRLLDEVTYPVMMHNLIDDKTKRDDFLIKNLFSAQKPPIIPLSPDKPTEVIEPAHAPGSVNKEMENGDILKINDGYAFIRSPKYPNNVFCHHTSLTNKDFSEIRLGQRVKFVAEQGDKGFLAVAVEVLD